MTSTQLSAPNASREMDTVSEPKASPIVPSAIPYTMVNNDLHAERMKR